MFSSRKSLLIATTLLFGVSFASAQTGDPPGRVGRISDLTGAVSLLPGGATDWSTATLNYPVSSGDALWADADGRAEVHVGASAVRLGAQTSIVFDVIEDYLTQVRIGQGSVQIRVRDLDPQESYEIDTPAGIVLLRSEGQYRIDVTPDGTRSTVTVRNGSADVMIGTTTYHVAPGSSATMFSSGSRPFATGPLITMDPWESWCNSRDQREDGITSTRYVSRNMVGYEDLDQYGSWRVDVSYGPVWEPRLVDASWAPYRFGHWEYIAPWGWTWVDDAPWGFAPFHYGRWVNRNHRWGWIPGTVRARPVYAPALVAFVGGAGWGASLSFGTGGGVGWIPLGPNEPFVPNYRASPVYRRSVNITNVNETRINVTNVQVTQIHYVNRSVPGGVTAVPRDAFIHAKPVGRAAVAIRPNDITTARPSVAPTAAGAPIVVTNAERARSQNVGVGRKPPTPIARPATPPVQWRGAPGQRGGTATPPPTRGANGQAGGRAVTPPPPPPPTRGGSGQTSGRAATPPPPPPPVRGTSGVTTTPPPPPPARGGRSVVTPPDSGRGGQRGRVPTRGATPPPPPPVRGTSGVTTTPPPPPPARGTSGTTTTPPPPPPTRGGSGRAATPPPPPPTRGTSGGGGTPPPPPPTRGRGRGGAPDSAPTPARGATTTTGRSSATPPPPPARGRGAPPAARGKALPPDSAAQAKAAAAAAAAAAGGGGGF